MGKAFDLNEAAIVQHGQERIKSETESTAKVGRYIAELDTHAKNPDPDLNVVSAAITNYCTEVESSVNIYRALSEKIYNINKQRIVALNKIGSDYRAKSTTINSAIAKLEGEVLTLEVQIRGIIGTYSKIAIDMNHNDASNAARELLAKF